MKILIIEDDTTIAGQLQKHLQQAGFTSHIEHDGESGQFEGEESGYDAILLDIGLPLADGFSIIKAWRKQNVTTPVIMITARNSKMDIVKGLNAGADDYITKPFDLDEVVARIRSTIRRYNGHHHDQIRYKNISLDMANHRFLLGDETIPLTRIEFLMLQYLFMHQGRPISVSELGDHAYDDFDRDNGIIVKHIANIRKKVGHDIVLTEANRGYYVPKDNHA